MPRYKFDDLVYNITEKATPKPGDEEMYIGLEHMDSNNLSITRWGSAVPLKGQKLCMKKGDILFGKRNTYLRRASIAPHDGLFSAHGMIFRPKTENITKEYLLFFIASDRFMDAAIRISVGSLSPTVNWKTLKELEFEIPELEEQKEKAAILSAMNRTKKAYQNLIIKTDELVKAQFIEMFGDIPKEQHRTIKDVCHIVTDGTHQPPKFVSEGIPFLLVSNIANNEVTYKTSKFITEETYNELIKRTPIEIGDILLSTVGSYGHPAIVKCDKKFCFQRHIAYLKPNNEIIDSVFLYATLLSHEVQSQIDNLVLGVAQKTLNLSAIRSIEIPIPPMEQQKTFCKVFEQAGQSKSALQQAVEKIDSLMKSLIQQDFSCE